VAIEGTENALACGWRSVYFSPANQKKVLFLTIGPPTPPPPLRQYSGRNGSWFRLGMSSWSCSASGRNTVYAEPSNRFEPARAAMFITPPPVRPISAS